MRCDLNHLSWHFIACSFDTHGLWAPDLCTRIALRTHKIKRIKISGFTFITWCPCKEVSGIWELKALKNTVLHMQARSWTGLESAVWKRGGSLQALCLQGDGSRPAGIKSRAPTTGGKAAVTAQHLPRTVSLCALGTCPGEKKKKQKPRDRYLPRL